MKINTGLLVSIIDNIAFSQNTEANSDVQEEEEDENIIEMVDTVLLISCTVNKIKNYPPLPSPPCPTLIRYSVLNQIIPNPKYSTTLLPTCMCQWQSPQTKVRGGVGDHPQHEFNGLDGLMDNNLTEIEFAT